MTYSVHSIILWWILFSLSFSRTQKKNHSFCITNESAIDTLPLSKRLFLMAAQEKPPETLFFSEYNFKWVKCLRRKNISLSFLEGHWFCFWGLIHYSYISDFYSEHKTPCNYLISHIWNFKDTFQWVNIMMTMALPKEKIFSYGSIWTEWICTDIFFFINLPQARR